MELTTKVFIILLISISPSANIVPSWSSTAYGAAYLSASHYSDDKSYKVYFIWVHAKVDGKALWMLLDTGSAYSNIQGSQVHKLGLDALAPSRILGTNRTLVAANGDNETLKTVDVRLSVDGSHPFNTAVTLYPKISDRLAMQLLSLHDLLQAYHGLKLNSCHIVYTTRHTTWSACRFL